MAAFIGASLHRHHQQPLTRSLLLVLLLQIVFSPFLEFVCEQRQVSLGGAVFPTFLCGQQHSASGNGSNFHFVCRWDRLQFWFLCVLQRIVQFKMAYRR
jgi:hypothetical protein